MLGRIELEVLATISELATKLNHSESYSRAVGTLVEKGLNYTKRDGRRKRAIPSDGRAVELYQNLVRQHSHVDFLELVTSKTLEVLYVRLSHSMNDWTVHPYRRCAGFFVATRHDVIWYLSSGWWKSRPC